MNKQFHSYGIYVVSHPMFFFIRPKLSIYKDNNGKPNGNVKWLFLRIALESTKVGSEKIIFRIPVNVFHVEIVLNFMDETSFCGILDTPIGSVMFKGRKLGKYS